MPNYCKKCGYVFGEGRVPKLVQKGVCPTCKSKLFETKESISYFQGRVEKSMPTWEDVVRNKYLKNIKVDNNLLSKNTINEQKQHKQELDKLKGNNVEIKPVKPIPKCPTCSSSNLKKITTSSKVMNTVLWGVFGTKRHKTFHCNDCGYEW